MLPIAVVLAILLMAGQAGAVEFGTDTFTTETINTSDWYQSYAPQAKVVNNMLMVSNGER